MSAIVATADGLAIVALYAGLSIRTWRRAEL